MSKILIKESEIRQYVRSLIKESFQTEERGASPALINKWINATPEEVNSWGHDPKLIGFDDLVKMVNRQPYNRRGFSPKAKDIEKAWRAANGLEPFPSNVKKIHRVNADGSWESDSQSQEQRKANINAAAKNWQLNKTIQNREIRDAEKAEQARLEAERIAKEREIRNFEEMMDWCVQNNIDPYSEGAKAQYEQAKRAENDKWYYDRGLDEFSRPALLRRMEFLQSKIDELKYSSDDWDKKVVASCAYCLNDTKKQLNRWFKGKEKLKPQEQEDNLDVNAIGQDAKAAAASDIYPQDFLNWCKQFGCEPDIPTKEVYDSYMSQYNKWCNSNGTDPSDPTAKETFNEFYSDYTKQQLNAIGNTLPTPQQNDTTVNNNDDLESGMFDDDNGRGSRDRRATIGQLDDPDETSDEEYNSWCIENDLDPDDETNRRDFDRLYGKNDEDEYDIEDVDDEPYDDEDFYDRRY